MIPLISIYVGGVLTLSGALFHCTLYKKLNWKTEFEKISELNARIINTMNIALALLFFLVGVISIIYAYELSQCIGFSKGFNIILTIFWFWRFIWQIVYLKEEKLSFLRIYLIVVLLLSTASYCIPVIYSFI